MTLLSRGNHAGLGLSLLNTMSPADGGVANSSHLRENNLEMCWPPSQLSREAGHQNPLWTWAVRPPPRVSSPSVLERSWEVL